MSFINHFNQLCKTYLFSKHARNNFPFPKEVIIKATKPLKLVYIDVCKLIYPHLFGKSKYFLLFIVYFSRKN